MFWSPEAAAAGIQPAQKISFIFFSLPFLTAGSFFLPQSLFWAPDREDSLPEKELIQFGHPPMPQRHGNPLPAWGLTANGSQDWAGFPLPGEPRVALNPGQ